MDPHKYEKNMLTLQNLIYSPIYLNDAFIDIIEIAFEDTGDATFCSPHAHTWYEFNYVISGSLITGSSDKEYNINANSFFIVPPGIEHYHKYNNKKPHKGIVVRWRIEKKSIENINPSNSLFDMLNDIEKFRLSLFEDNYAIGFMLERLLIEANDSPSSIFLQSLLLQIIMKVFLVAKPYSSKPIKTHEDIYNRNIIRKIEICLNDNILEEIDVQSVASSLHMSYGHLARLYKKLTGQTIMERLNDIRLEKSLYLLEKSGYMIKEIAFKSGFSSQYYFTRVFKEKFGLTPSQYRKSS